VSADRSGRRRLFWRRFCLLMGSFTASLGVGVAISNHLTVVKFVLTAMSIVFMVKCWQEMERGDPS